MLVLALGGFRGAECGGMGALRADWSINWNAASADLQLSILPVMRSLPPR